MKDERCEYHDEVKQDLWSDGKIYCESCLLEEMQLPSIVEQQEEQEY